MFTYLVQHVAVPICFWLQKNCITELVTLPFLEYMNINVAPWNLITKNRNFSSAEALVIRLRRERETAYSITGNVHIDKVKHPSEWWMGFLVILLSISFPVLIPQWCLDCMGKAKGELSCIFYFCSRNIRRFSAVFVNRIDFIFTSLILEFRVIFAPHNPKPISESQEIAFSSLHLRLCFVLEFLLFVCLFRFIWYLLSIRQRKGYFEMYVCRIRLNEACSLFEHIYYIMSQTIGHGWPRLSHSLGLSESRSSFRCRIRAVISHLSSFMKLWINYLVIWTSGFSSEICIKKIFPAWYLTVK